MGRPSPITGIALALAVAMVATNVTLAVGEDEEISFRKCWNSEVVALSGGRHKRFSLTQQRVQFTTSWLDCPRFTEVVSCFKQRTGSDDLSKVRQGIGASCEHGWIWDCSDSLGCKEMFPKKVGDNVVKLKNGDYLKNGDKIGGNKYERKDEINMGSGDYLKNGDKTGDTYNGPHVGKSQVQLAINSAGAQFAQQQMKACEGSSNGGSLGAASAVCCKSKQGAVCCSAAAFNQDEVKTTATGCPQDSPYVQQWLTSTSPSKSTHKATPYIIYLAPTVAASSLLVVLAWAWRRLRTKSNRTDQDLLSLEDPDTASAE